MSFQVTVVDGRIKIVGNAYPTLENPYDLDIKLGANDTVKIRDVREDRTLVNTVFSDYSDPSEISAILLAEALAALFAQAKSAGVQEVSVGSDPSTAGAPTVVEVDTSTTVILAANADRTEAIIRNDDADPVYLQEGAAATLTSAIKLEQDDTAFFDSTLAINGIRAVATADVSVTEKTK